MKNFKKALIGIITVVLSLLTVAACMFTALGDDTYVPHFNAGAFSAYQSQGYGSFDKGVVAPFSFYRYYHPSVQYGEPSVDGHPNLDFQQGYKYWHDNSSQVKINTDKSGNSYATIVGDKEQAGISTIKFAHSKLKPGDKIGMLYKWRNASHQRAVEVSLGELYEIDDEATAWKTINVAGNDGRGNVGIWAVDEEDDTGWNITLARVYNPVKEATGSIPIVYFSAAIQSTVVPDIFVGTDMDDLQIVRLDESSGLVSDLDGKLLYNLNSLPKLEQPDYVFGDLGETDPKANVKINVKDILGGKIDLNAGVNNAKAEKEENSGIALWVWIVIAAGVVLLLAAAAVIIIIVIKKKKASAVSANETEEAPKEIAEDKTE